MTYPTFTDDERERLGNGNPNTPAVTTMPRGPRTTPTST